MCTVMWGPYTDCNSNAVELPKCGRHVCLGAYANNVKCAYTPASGHIIDHSEFISDIYNETVEKAIHQ